ncbi:MAG TPA: LuxR C-terminal-related transcriptional regulator, partial [Armatimonadota bacterium]
MTHELRILHERIAQLESEQKRSWEAGRREGEDLFRRMADAAPVMMWMAGTDSHCTFFNKLWLAYRGRSMAQETGDGWLEGVHADDTALCTETYMRAFQARRPFQMQYRLQRYDGEYRWILDSGVPVFSQEGEFTGYIGSGVDIQDTKPAGPLVQTGPIPLTQRERQVLVLIADGKSTKEVAAALGISYKTADSHRSKIMEKLDIHETATLVRYAVRNNLV